MAVLTVRLSDELHRAVKQKGGSPWVRVLLERELGVGPATSAPTGELEGSPVSVADRVLAQLSGNGQGDKSHSVTNIEKLCPRWMHHRVGAVCKICGQ